MNTVIKPAASDKRQKVRYGIIHILDRKMCEVQGRKARSISHEPPCHFMKLTVSCRVLSAAKCFGNFLCFKTEFRVDFIQQCALAGTALSCQNRHLIPEDGFHFPVQMVFGCADHFHRPFLIFLNHFLNRICNAKVAFGYAKQRRDSGMGDQYRKTVNECG